MLGGKAVTCDLRLVLVQNLEVGDAVGRFDALSALHHVPATDDIYKAKSVIITGGVMRTLES